MGDMVKNVTEKAAGFALKAAADVAKKSAKLTAKVLALIPKKASKMAKKQLKDIPLEKKVAAGALAVAVIAVLCGCKKNK